MGQEELMRMRIRSMMYKYQTKLYDIDQKDSDYQVKQVLNEIIDDLVELSSMLNSSKSL